MTRRRRSSTRSRLAAFILASSAAFSSQRAAAHTPGLSRSSFELDPAGVVHAKLQFAIADLPAEAHASEASLAELTARGVDVRADGASCPAHFVASRPEGPDGVELDVDFACQPGASVIEAELFILTDLAASHQNVATIHAGAATRQAALDGAHRSIRLESMPPTDPSLRSGVRFESTLPTKASRPVLPFAIAAACVFAALAALWVAVRHRRSAR